MEMESTNTKPKPFIFVLIPFNPDFNDIYEFGIKGAANEIGAYAERVLDQKYTGGVLDRIYNQINKADVIVADMTGKSPNVFYEVGYAHALGKIVLLVTKNVNDIPFDLKHRPHIEYGNIDTLRTKLIEWLRWGIIEAKKQADQSTIERYKVTLMGTHIPEIRQLTDAIPIVQYSGSRDVFGSPSESVDFSINVRVQNTSEVPQTITHISLFSASEKIKSSSKGESVDVPQQIPPHLNDGSSINLNVRHRLDIDVPPLSPDSVEEFPLKFSLSYERRNLKLEGEEFFALKMYSGNISLFFPFRLKIRIQLNLNEPATIPKLHFGGFDFARISKDK